MEPIKQIFKKNPIPHAYRVAFLANHFLGPVLPTFKKKWRLTRTEVNILFSLSQTPGLNARDICRQTGRPKNSVSRAVHSLVQRGYITQSKCPDDSRRSILNLTKEGKEVYKEFVTLLKVREKAIYKSLNRSELKTLNKLLIKVIDHSEGWIGIY